MNTTVKAGLIFFMCVLDCLFTWWGVRAGYLVEMNILLAALMKQALIFPFLIKNGYTLALLILLLRLEKHSPVSVNTGLNFVVAVYAAVTALHCRLIYLNFIA